MLFDEFLYEFGQGTLSYPDDLYVLLGKRDQDFFCRAACYGFCNFRCHLAHHGMGHYNPNRSNDNVQGFYRLYNGIFTGGASIGPCFKHLGGGDSIGAQGYNFDGFLKSVP